MFSGCLLFYMYVQYLANFELDNITSVVDPQYRSIDV